MVAASVWKVNEYNDRNKCASLSKNERCPNCQCANTCQLTDKRNTTYPPNVDFPVVIQPNTWEVIQQPCKCDNLCIKEKGCHISICTIDDYGMKCYLCFDEKHSIDNSYYEGIQNVRVPGNYHSSLLYFELRHICFSYG